MTDQRDFGDECQCDTCRSVDPKFERELKEVMTMPVEFVPLEEFKKIYPKSERYRK